MLNNKPSGRYTIDRFESNLAVLVYREDENIELITPRTLLPNRIEKGSIVHVEIKAGALKSVKYMKKETEAIRKQNAKLLHELINKKPLV